ncbi:hypothetical protein RBA63_18595 [Brenneria goodwinii]|uniref:hypothetical protein n=1 Tax=Brenneria goodwinii TaxID=1109412 RepID=UPI0036DFAE04
MNIILLSLSPIYILLLKISRMAHGPGCKYMASPARQNLSAARYLGIISEKYHAPREALDKVAALFSVPHQRKYPYLRTNCTVRHIGEG